MRQKLALILKTRRGSKRRGMAVLGTLLLLFCLLSMALVGLLSLGGRVSTGMLVNSDNGSYFAKDLQQSISAVNLADAGVQYTILWLSALGAPPSNPSAFSPASSSFTPPLWNATTQTGSPPRALVQFPDANHTFAITIYPASGNANSSQKGFLIESIGSAYGFTQVLHVYVTQTSFAHYAAFESAGGSGYWSSAHQQFDGPVHMNTVSSYLDLDWNDGTAPVFSYNGPDAFTCGFTLGWMHNLATVSGPPASNDTAGWNALSPYGPTSIKQNQNPVPLPTSAADRAKQETAALGTLSTAPTSSVGATLCPGGGIYIHGDIQQMTLSVSGTNSATQIVEVYQIDPGNSAKDYTKITYDVGANQTSIETGTFTTAGTITLNSSSSWPTPVAGLTNGVIYCDGAIGTTTQYSEGGLKGVIADNAFSGSTETHSNGITIATSPTNNIQLDGSIVTNTQRQIQQNAGGQYEFQDDTGAIVTSATSATPAGDVPVYVEESSDTGQFLTKAGRLGLVTDNIVYGTYAFNSTGLTETGYITNIELDAAYFLYGGEGGSPYHGSQPSLAFLSNGSDIHGSGSFNWPAHTFTRADYDNRLGNDPPPYFPTTDNRYTIISWQRVNSTVQGTA